MRYLIPVAILLWLAALAATLIFRGNALANGALLVVSLGMIALGWWRSKQSR